MNMITRDNVFLAQEGEKGLNVTSAQHLCAIASHIVDQLQAATKEISFINEETSIVGSKDFIPTASGCSQDKLLKLQEILEKISELNGFIAWFAEARKAYLEYCNETTSVSIEEWAKAHSVELPVKPSRPKEIEDVSLQDMINELSVKDRQLYLALEAKAAVLGQFIHPSGPMERARKTLHKRVATPYSTCGSGRDTVVSHYQPSCKVEDVDKTYNKLQHLYREVEQNLNHMKADLQKAKNARNIEISNENRKRYAEYDSEREAYQSTYRQVEEMYSQYLIDVNEANNKIKLAIPHAFVSTVTYLNNIDK